MRQFERYTINFAQRTDPGGTHEKPKLLQITSGERSEESVIYHMKIGQLYQQMHINKVNNGTVNLNCISPYCKATAIIAKFFIIHQNLLMVPRVQLFLNRTNVICVRI